MTIILKGGDIPPEAVELAKTFFFTITVIALGIPLIRLGTRSTRFSLRR